jgi:hypothetical protein
MSRVLELADVPERHRGAGRALGFIQIFGFAAFIWLIPGTAPASDQTTVSQINIQELMRNTHDLPDTTVSETL